MKRIHLRGFLATMALIVGGRSAAEDPEIQTTRAMIDQIEFITENSSLRYDGEDLPKLIIMPEYELQLRYRSSESDKSAIEGDSSFGRVSAFYNPFSNEIFLADLGPIIGPGLFHEMVHFLQAVNGKNDMFTSHRACLEAEAYELQAIWQAEQAIDLASKPEYGFVMTLYAVCNDADFSWIDSANAN